MQAPSRAVVTGATSGVGLETARSLAAAGLDVVLAVRNADKGEDVAGRIRSVQRGSQVSVVHLDLADLDSVRTAAATLATGPVEVLVNNAGVAGFAARRTTVQGHELNMGVNHLGHFLLTALLAPALRESPRPRVVCVTSLAYQSVGRLDPRLGDGDGYQGWRAYGQSKLALGLFGLELHRRATAAGWPLVSVLAHPGWSATHLFDRAGVVARASGMLASTAAHGAQSQIRAALDPALHGGELLGPRFGAGGRPKIIRQLANLRDRESARRLWELSEDRTGETFDIR